jgi:sugar phosphate isomerase/epimerase
MAGLVRESDETSSRLAAQPDIMDIGIKLDIGFSENQSHRRLFGGGDPLQTLWNLGFRAVETAVEPHIDFEALAGYTRQCCEAGFRVSLHPYSERMPCNPANFGGDQQLCRRFHTKVFLAAEEAARLQGREVTVNIHGAAGDKTEDRRALVDKTVRFFVWARQWCFENAPGAKPIVELQFRPYPDETIQRIGDEYEELLEIATRAGVGVCWDLGHAYMNATRFGTSLDPPKKLLRRIVHIHCHDVKDIDHYPLEFDRVPWKRMLTLAVDGGFDGAVILEVPPDNFLSTGGLHALSRSVEKIKTIAAARQDA